MTKEQIKSNFRAAHAAQLSKVSEAHFNQLDAAATLATERGVLRALEAQFKADMATPDDDNPLGLPGMEVGRKK